MTPAPTVEGVSTVGAGATPRKNLVKTIYYQEECGDYMVVHYIGRDLYVRATALKNIPSSICTTTTDRGYIKTCKRVLKKEVPQAYLSKF